jgi:hypothetical protein
MKAGDLVRWTNPGYEDMGIVLKIWVNGLDMIIYWFGCPDHSGSYPPNHKYLEVISESR